MDNIENTTPAAPQEQPPEGYGAAPAPLPGYGYAPASPAPAGPTPPPEKPKRPRGRRTQPWQVALLAGCLAVLLFVCMLFFTVLSLGNSFSSLFTPETYNNNPPKGSFAVITVVGTIQNAASDSLGINNPSYYHGATVSYIKQLARTDNNTGILLYLNTPGGGVYESDELYLALMAYKEETGRPVWAFMGQTCASGGVYAAAAADYIIANRNTTTGSIGVYIALTDTSELYGKLGIETVLVRSGENKGTGTSGVPITAQQRAVYQSIVDESYDTFVEIVAEGRNMDIDEVRDLADGRVYSGTQALELGLVDELGDWEMALGAFVQENGGSPFYPNFSSKTTIGSILSGIFGALPQGDVEALVSMANQYPVGVPMVLYNP